VPPVPELTGVPDTVTLGPPGFTVVPVISNRVGLAVNVTPPADSISAGVITAVENLCVLLSTTATPPLDGSKMGVPETMIAPPGVRVRVPIMKAKEGLAV